MPTGLSKRWGQWLLLGVGVAVACLLTAEDAAGAEGDVLRVGVYPNKPLVFVDDDGTARGVYVDILDKAAAQEGWDIQHVPGSWQECLDRLNSGQIDLRLRDVLATLDTFLAKQKEGSAYHRALRRWLNPGTKPTSVWVTRTVVVLAVMLAFAGAFAARYRLKLGSSNRELDTQGLRLDDEVRRRTSADEKLLEADQALAAHRKALKLIYDVSLHRGASFTSLCEQLAQKVAEELEAEYVGVTERAGGRLEAIAEVVAGTLVDGDPLSDSSGFALRVLEGGKTAIEPVEVSQSEKVAAHPGPEANRSFLGTPIRNNAGELLGVLSAGSVRDGAFGLADGFVFETLAAYLGKQFEIDALQQERDRARRMELLGQLTSGIAHEVRNPVNAILATTEALELDIGEDPEHGESIRQIHLQVERLAVLMRDLLDFGKPVPEASRSAYRLSDICSRAVDLWCKSPTARDCGGQIVCDGDVGSASVCVDRDKLDQVIINLLDNAVQHSSPSSEVRLVLFPQSNSYAGFRVVDTGTGVPEDDLPHLFEPFYTKRKRGTGLGLSIVKHIIESHDGTVAICNNEPPPGCTVEVLLPVIDKTPDTTTVTG